MDKKKSSLPDEQRKETEEAAQKAASAGYFKTALVQFGQRIGIVEQTKLEPKFQSNINKLISYHNTIYNIVDSIELQIQVNPSVTAMQKVVSPEGENLWEMLGGWFHYMTMFHFEGHDALMLQKYSHACGKIAQKEIHVQKKTRAQYIRKMRMYTGDESFELNDNVKQLNDLLHGIDETRHLLKHAQTTNEVKTRGDAYHRMIKAFNRKGNEVQASLDEVPMEASLHQKELLKFAGEVSKYHDFADNHLTEVLLRLGINPNVKPNLKGHNKKASKIMKLF
ncbi:unnamed protein product [Caenorhabditis sp. 36 PRJEB53466]|nr:unnamed protein product [Caenorhabditis sp. 36 PRJEB53466]